MFASSLCVENCAEKRLIQQAREGFVEVHALGVPLDRDEPRFVRGGDAFDPLDNTVFGSSDDSKTVAGTVDGLMVSGRGRRLGPAGNGGKSAPIFAGAEGV